MLFQKKSPLTLTYLFRERRSTCILPISNIWVWVLWQTYRFYFGRVGKEKNIFWRLQNYLSPSHNFVEMEIWLSFLREKQKMENNALEKMFNKIVDLIYETFIRKYYFVKISQSKKGHVYLIVRKKAAWWREKRPT